MKTIDFVIPWVDGSDPEWRRKKESCVASSDEEGNSPERFRDWGLLRYWFRAVEKNAPWVRRIYLVTDRQIPDFIRQDHPKLRMVFHDEYIPSEYLPVFSANPIELNFHRLSGLSERFVYLNDDMFLNRPMAPEDFFRKGKPCYALVERPIVPRCPVGLIQSIVLNDMGVVNRHLTREGLRKKPWLYLNPRYGRHGLKNLLMLPFREFQHFEDDHMPCPFTKSLMEEVWAQAGDVLDATCRRRFRNREDVNQYLFRYWALATGQFSPIYRESGYYSLSGETVRGAVEDILHASHPLICLNDGAGDDYEALCEQLQEAFERRYPEPSSFER